jgi:hypothetical protein
LKIAASLLDNENSLRQHENTFSPGEGIAFGGLRAGNEKEGTQADAFFLNAQYHFSSAMTLLIRR